MTLARMRGAARQAQNTGKRARRQGLHFFLLLAGAACFIGSHVSAFPATPMLSSGRADRFQRRVASRHFTGGALSAYTAHQSARLGFQGGQPSLPALADKKNDASPNVGGGEDGQPASDVSPSQQETASISPSKFLASLRPICNELQRQGHQLFWVGASADTLSQAVRHFPSLPPLLPTCVTQEDARFSSMLPIVEKPLARTPLRPLNSSIELAVQLMSEGEGVTFAGLNFDLEEPSAIAGTFPGAAKQIRMDILRFATSNMRKLEGLDRADVELASAAHKYGVRINCYEVAGDAPPSKVVFDPPQGFVPRAELRIVRAMGHYFSTTRCDLQSDQTFSNLSDEEALLALGRRAEALGLSPSEPHLSSPSSSSSSPSPSSSPAGLSTSLASANDGAGSGSTGGGEQGERYVSRVICSCEAGADAASSLGPHLDQGDRLENLPSDKRQDFASALAKALLVAEVPIQTSAVGSGKAGDAPLQSAARVARSDLIMYTAGHPRVASAPELHRNPLAAAAKYRIKIDLTYVADGFVHRATYDPAPGVVAKAVVKLACSRDVFFAVVPCEPKGDDVEAAEEWIKASRSLPATFKDRDERAPAAAAAAAAASDQGLSGDGSDDEEGDSRGERRVVWDPRTLSWQVAYGDAPAPQAVSSPSSPSPGGSSSFLPRFSAHHKNAKASSSVSAATVGDARLGASLAGRNGAGAAINFGGMGSAEFVPSEGMQDMESKLKEDGLVLDRTDGACNLYLALAKLLKSAGLEVQGVMFTTFGEQQSALIGAMSRKARLDIRRYTVSHMDEFQEMGRWLGDHDMAAAASVYAVRLVVHMIVFDKESEKMVTTQHAYEPVGEQGPVCELHLCLDKGRFWPIYPASADGTKPTYQPLPPKEVPVKLPKPRSALERVWADYGAKGEPDEMPPAPDAAASALRAERDWMAGVAHATPVVVDARGKHTATIIWLHGLGGTGSDWEEMCRALHLPWVKFVLPTAKRCAVGLWNGTVVPSWFDVSAGALKVHSASLNAGAETSQRIYERLVGDEAPLEASTSHVLSLIQAEIEAGIPPHRIFLAGYSQGASVALNAALSAGLRLGGVAALSMFQPSRLARIAGQVERSSKRVPAWELGCYTNGIESKAGGGDEHGLGDLPVLFCHGMGDKVVTPEFGSRFYSKAREMGIDAQVRQFEGLGHSLSFDELLEFRSFIADRCLPGGGQGYGTAPLDSRQSPIGRRWGDGSPVSDKAGGLSDRDLKDDAEKALGEFAESWADPSREVWRYHLKRAP